LLASSAAIHLSLITGATLKGMLVWYQENWGTKMTDQPNSQLTRIVERIEKQEDEISLLKQDVKDIYIEAKSGGYDVKIIRKIIAMRKMDDTKRKEENVILAAYMREIGMTPIELVIQTSYQKASD
jgi:uncharacterized protein (UPF0335 family)